MKSLTWMGPGSMQLRDAPIPQPRPGEVLIQVKAVGICGSELEGYVGKSSIRRPPLVMGHEFCGVVVGVNEGEEYPPMGTRVVINPIVACGRCEICVRGHSNICPNRELIGAQRPGGMAEFVAVPISNLYQVPSGVSDVQATLTEPLAVSIHAVEAAGCRMMDRAVVIGAGAIGLLVLQSLMLRGVGETLVLETNPHRRQNALDLGAAHVLDPTKHTADEMRGLLGDFGADVAMDCVGRTEARQLALRLTRPGGRIAFLGLHNESSELDVNGIVRSETKLIGCYTYSPIDFRKALLTLEKGVIKSDSWLVERPLSEGARSFEELVTSPSGVCKIVLKP